MKRQKHFNIPSPVSVRQRQTPKDPIGHRVLAPLGSLVPGIEGVGGGWVGVGVSGQVWVWKSGVLHDCRSDAKCRLTSNS